MRYRIKDYHITIGDGNVYVHIKVPNEDFLVVTPVKEAIRLIIDETAKVVLCSSMRKDSIVSVTSTSVSGYDVAIGFAIPEGKTIAATDMFTIAVDWGTSAEDIIDALGDINIDTSDLAKEAQVKDGNDTAISVSKDIRSEVGIGSDTAAETGTLFAVVNWIKNTVKSIYNAITDGTNGLAALKQAVAAIVIPTDYAKEATAQAIATDVTSVKTQLSAIDPDIAQAKNRLAVAINAKGGQVTSNTTLTDMAEAVRNIIYEPKILNGGEIYASQLFANGKMWNLYDILYKFINNAIICDDNNGVVLDALNVTGFVLGQYYRDGTDNISFSSPFVVCEKWEGRDVWVYYPLGGTHIWTDDDNGYVDRWVCFPIGLNGTVGNYVISNAATCPRKIYIGKSVGTISMSVAGRVNDIIIPTNIPAEGQGIVDGVNEIQNINFSSTQSWSNNVVINHISEHNAGYVFVNSGATFITLGIKTLNGGEIFRATSNSQSNGINNVNLPELTEINGGSVFSAYQNSFQGLNYLSLPKLEIIKSGGKVFTNNNSNGQYSAGFKNLKELYAPLLRVIQGSAYLFHIMDCGLQLLEEVYLPSLTEINGYLFYLNNFYTDGNAGSTLPVIRRLRLPSLIRTNSNWIYIMYQTNYNKFYNLIDVEVGEMVTSLPLGYWQAQNIRAVPADILTMIDNIKNHIALRVSDRTGLSALTATFGFTSALNNYSAGTAEENAEIIAAWTEVKQIFANKNWNVA